MFVAIEMGLPRKLIIEFVGVRMLCNFEALRDVCLRATLPAQLEDHRLFYVQHDACDFQVDHSIQLVADHASEQFAHLSFNKVCQLLNYN